MIRGGVGTALPRSAPLTRTIAMMATPMPTNATAPGRSPRASPTATGMETLTTAVVGATTLIEPFDSAW